MKFSRPEYWSRKPFHSPWDLPNPGIESRSPPFQGDSLSAEPPGKPQFPGVTSYLEPGVADGEVECGGLRSGLRQALPVSLRPLPLPCPTPVGHWHLLHSATPHPWELCIVHQQPCLSALRCAHLLLGFSLGPSIYCLAGGQLPKATTQPFPFWEQRAINLPSCSRSKYKSKDGLNIILP